MLTLALAAPAFAQTASPITIGAGLRTSFVHTDPDDDDGTDAFVLDSVRLYVSGSATDKIKIMFNTEYNGAENDVNVLDAAAQFGFSGKFNVWVGRFLPPSDRANLYGPYYAHHWAVYTDGVQDGYPFIFQGRANGAMYWGQFGKVKVSAGAFDGESLTGDDTVMGAGRVQVNFWDQEAGYYLNGTYYGDKNLLTIGAAGQVQGSDKSAYSVDFLLERKVAAAARSRWRPSGRSTTASEATTRATAPTTAGTCSGATCFRKRWAWAGSRCSASSRRRASAKASRRSTPTTTRRPPS